MIAIIAILAAILFPVFAKAREKAKAASCMSNVKQVVLAQLMYASDHDEILSNHYMGYPAMSWAQIWIWTRNMQPYIKNNAIFDCPSVGFRYAANPTGVYIECYHLPSISINYPLTGYNVTHLSEIEAPAEVLDFIDGNNYASAPSTSPWVYGVHYEVYRHNEMANAGFLDGHSKAMKVDEVNRIADNVRIKLNPFELYATPRWGVARGYVHWAIPPS